MAIEIDLEILQGDDGRSLSPEEVIENLKKQLLDPFSALRTTLKHPRNRSVVIRSVENHDLVRLFFDLANLASIVHRQR